MNRRGLRSAPAVFFSRKRAYKGKTAVPHTKQQIQHLLDHAGIRPRHTWGQNFLIDLNLMRLLVDAAELRGHELILEAGCGTGSLTSLLAEKGGAVIAAEIDPCLQKIARAELSDYDDVHIVAGDVLANKNSVNPQIISALREARQRVDGPFLLMANLPYQAASPLIVNLVLTANEGIGVLDGFYVTVQLEVAERMIAHPGRKVYGLLSILLQAAGTVEIIRKLNPQSFWPPPQVHSAFVAWRRDHEKCHRIADMGRLKTVIDLLLRHRRKKIRSCLQNSLPGPDLDTKLQSADIDPDARGETIPPEGFVRLANQWPHSL